MGLTVCWALGEGRTKKIHKVGTLLLPGVTLGTWEIIYAHTTVSFPEDENTIIGKVTCPISLSQNDATVALHIYMVSARVCPETWKDGEG